MINKLKSTKLGFTLNETMIVISIVGIVAAASFLMFSESRRQVVLDDAQASVVNALEEARSRAATGVGEASHGVYITNNKIYPCQGDPCATGTEFLELKPLVSASKTPNPLQPIIFNRLSATSSENATITIEYAPAGSTTVSVTEDGIIEK